MMNKTRFILSMITVLIILCFTFSSVGADFSPQPQTAAPQGGTTQVPDLSQFTMRPDDYTPPAREIQADPYQKAEPISPNYESLYTKLPRYYFYRDFFASEYQVQVWNQFQNIKVDSMSGTGSCNDYYCSLQGTTVLKIYRYQYDRGLYFWKVRARVNGAWQPWSNEALFAILSTGFNDSYNLIPKKWWPWNSQWFWNGTKGIIKTSGVPYQYNSVYHEEYFANFDYTVRMKRKLTPNNTNGVVVWGAPGPETAHNIWYNGVYFAYYNDGDVWSWTTKNGIMINMSHWTSDAIVPYAWNELHIVGVYPYVDMWINGVYQGWYDASALSSGGGLVGVDMYSIGDGGTFIVDSAKLTALPWITSSMTHDPAMQLKPATTEPALLPNTAP